MPKVMQYNKGSIIYFAGDRDDRVFILQKGCVIISTTDIETNLPVTEQIKNGEFFGVKSALGHFPREETATVLIDSVCLSLTVQEFETIFSSNKTLILKMLRVFSNQLRKVHSQIEEILNKGQDINRQSGLLGVAQAFFHDEKWRSCADVCLRYLKYYPNSADENAVKKMFITADARAKQSQSLAFDDGTENISLNDKSLKVFELPAFARFAKKYSPGQVIISEFEPGESLI